MIHAPSELSSIFSFIQDGGLKVLVAQASRLLEKDTSRPSKDK